MPRKFHHREQNHHWYLSRKAMLHAVKCVVLFCFCIPSACMHFLLMHTINVVYIIGCGQKTQYINMSNRSCIYWYFHGIKTCENKLSAKFLLKLFSINGPYEINVWPHPRLFPFFTRLCSHFASKYYCECKQEDKNRGVLGMRLMNVWVTVLISDDGSPFSTTTWRVLSGIALPGS